MARAKWKLLVPTATLTMIPFTVQSAQAFFPPVSPPATVTPVSPPPFVVVPPVAPPPVIVVPPTHPPGGSTVPEPGTLGATIAGLTATAGWAAPRRKKAAA